MNLAIGDVIVGIDIGTSKVSSVIGEVNINAIGNGTKWMTAKGWSAYTTKGNTKSDTLSEYFYFA